MPMPMPWGEERGEGGTHARVEQRQNQSMKLQAAGGEVGCIRVGPVCVVTRQW
jgi:hypothetical protein